MMATKVSGNDSAYGSSELGNAYEASSLDVNLAKLEETTQAAQEQHNKMVKLIQDQGNALTQVTQERDFYKEQLAYANQSHIMSIDLCAEANKELAKTKKQLANAKEQLEALTANAAEVETKEFTTLEATIRELEQTNLLYDVAKVAAGVALGAFSMMMFS